MKNLTGILKAAICSAAGIFIMTGCTNYSKMLEDKPQEYISLATENTTKAMVKGSFAEEYQLLEQALKDGSFSLEFEAEGIKFSGECYVNEKDEMSSQMYTLTGSKGTSAQVYAFAGKDIMKLGSIGQSGSHIYSFDMNTLEDKLASSIFAPDSGSSYAMSKEDYETFLELAGEINSAVKGETGEDDKTSEYADAINAYFEEHPPVTSEKTEITINGESVEANVVQYDVPKEGVNYIAEQIAGAIAEQGAYEDYSEEEIKSQILSVFDNTEDYSIQLIYYVNSKTNELMQIDMAVNVADKYGNYEVYLSIVYGADPANSEKQSIIVNLSADYHDDSFYYSSEDNENIIISADIMRSENKTEIVINYSENNESQEIATIVSEKNGESYSVTAKIPELEATAGMTGTIVTNKDSFEMTIDRLFLNYGSTEMAYLPKAVITVKKGGEILNLDAEKEFLDITEEEMDALLENIGSDFEAVFMEFAEDSAIGSEMLDYVKKSKTSSANMCAKTAFTAIATEITMMDIDGEPLTGSVITGDSGNVIIDGKEVDLTDYLGRDFYGYLYAEVDPGAYAVEYALWSEEPIPEKYSHQLSRDEQNDLADEGIFIGCYPFDHYA